MNIEQAKEKVFDCFYNLYYTQRMNCADVDVCILTKSQYKESLTDYQQKLIKSLAYFMVEAYDNGHDKGHDHGYCTGYDMGYDSGYITGSNTL